MNTEHSKIPFTVVLFLGAISILLSGGLLILAWTGHPIDNGLSTLAGTAIGALGAVLAKTSPNTPATGSPIDPVTVATAPGQPVETTPAPDAATTGDKP